jgi:hypothetical protein
MSKLDTNEERQMGQKDNRVDPKGGKTRKRKAKAKMEGRGRGSINWMHVAQDREEWKSMKSLSWVLYKGVIMKH